MLLGSKKEIISFHTSFYLFPPFHWVWLFSSFQYLFLSVLLLVHVIVCDCFWSKCLMKFDQGVSSNLQKPWKKFVVLKYLLTLNELSKLSRLYTTLSEKHKHKESWKLNADCCCRWDYSFYKQALFLTSSMTGGSHNC